MQLLNSVITIAFLAATLAIAACGDDGDGADGDGQIDGGDGAADAGEDGDAGDDADAGERADAGDDADAGDRADAGERADAGALVAPPFRNPVDLADEQLAIAALALLGAPVPGSDGTCDRCHGLTRQSLRYWRALGDTASSSCLTDLAVEDPATARVMVDCLRSSPDDPGSPFQAVKLGVFTTAAHLDWFSYLFEVAYGVDGDDEHAAFVTRVGMPRGDGEPLAQGDFDIVAEYFARGLPLLDSVLPNDPPPQQCTAGVSADVAAHVDEMALAGWAAQNAERAILMHGCGGASDPRDCLADRPRIDDWEGMAGTAVRRLRDVGYTSAYWTRSSADGRFVAHGGSSSPDFSATFVDLQTDTEIPANAFYDPGFFPDNSGFAFQSSGAHFCEQSVLTAGPTEVTFEEPGCATTEQIGLYQHLGAAVGGGDYWVVDGQFVSDNGGIDPTLSDPAAFFSASATARLTPMVHQGNQFLPGDTEQVNTRFEGDSVLSPSARLLISRVAGPGDRQLGFVMRQVIATPTPGGYQIETPEVARYCVNGGKPGFSYDERWLTYHHYVEAADAVELGYSGPGDPRFADYLSLGAANVYVLDVLTGESRRVTRMAPGEYALFPHFRSDGWIYFMVRAPDPGETIAATDAALVLAQ